jgi:hypothetical protein
LDFYKVSWPEDVSKQGAAHYFLSLNNESIQHIKQYREQHGADNTVSA